MLSQLMMASSAEGVVRTFHSVFVQRETSQIFLKTILVVRVGEEKISRIDRLEKQIYTLACALLEFAQRGETVMAYYGDLEEIIKLYEVEIDGVDED